MNYEPLKMNEKLLAAQARWKHPVRATYMFPSVLLEHTENGMGPAAGERGWNAAKPE